MAELDWVRGDLLGHDLPAHVDALRDGGPAFLTRAMRAAGSMGEDNRVTEIRRLEPFRGGSTGRKAVLAVGYERPDPDLPEELFVKFSRDFDDELRDRGKRQMEAEVRFALLSTIPDFPVAVPRCLFADYHVESGSGVLVTERIEFGCNGIEPHHPKARDREVDDLLGHYEALVAALARLAGSHRAGRFPASAMAPFERRPRPARDGGRASRTPDDVRQQIAGYAEFAARHPQLLPPSIRSDAFLARLLRDAPRSVEHAAALRAAQQDAAEELTAFCHWNANIDNAWFWRESDGSLACGLLDWGNVGQMNMVTALVSCLTFAEPDFLLEHLDHLLERFAAEFEGAGGGPLDPAFLKLHLELQLVSGGLQWPLGAVPLIERSVPDLGLVVDRFDARIADEELPRTQLHLLTTYLVLWEQIDAGALIDWAIARAAAATTDAPGPRSLSERLDADRAALAGQVAALEAQFQAFVEAAELVATDDEHDPEGHTIAFERQQVAGLLQDARRRLAGLDEARRRLDEGTYGRCVACGGAIGSERLAALPGTEHCIGCAP